MPQLHNCYKWSKDAPGCTHTTTGLGRAEPGWAGSSSLPEKGSGEAREAAEKHNLAQIQLGMQGIALQ